MRLVFWIFLLPAIALSQSISLPLIKANSFYFRNNVFVYGFQKNKSETEFKIYKVNKELNKIDSLIILLDKEKPEDFLEISADTLHDYLNFYLQKINSKNLATLIRLNDSLKLMIKFNNIESNKINSLTAFENEKYTYNNTTYTIRNSEDSTGKQFFLSRYDIISQQKPFEYKLIWQYPLEKKNINLAHVFYGNNESLYLYINIISGEKKGQWILKMDANSGKIHKGIKLNGKTDSRTYIYSNYFYDSKTKEILITGNIYNEQQVDFEEKQFAFTNLNKQNTFFFVTIDSLCEKINRNEKTVPFAFNNIKIPSKELIFYHVRIKTIQKNSAGDFTAYCSLYKSVSGDILFLYETGYYINLTLNESDVEFYADKINYSLNSLPGIVNSDKKDLSGKIELVNLMEFDKLLFFHPVSDIERAFGKDDLKNSKWIISKTDINTAKKTFYQINIGKKGPEHKIILENSKYNFPEFYPVNNDKAILFNSDKELNTFSLSLKNW